MQLDGNRHGTLAALPALVGGAPGVVNLEGPIARAPISGPGLRLVNPPSAADDLAAAGVRVATLANNHARDAGPGGERTTARSLATRGVMAAGREIGPARITVAGTRIVVVARDLADRVLARSASFDDELRAARAGADALVVSYHVTGPPSYLPAEPLVRAVDRALAAGASVVVVHGSHVLGRVERAAAAR